MKNLLFALAMSTMIFAGCKDDDPCDGIDCNNNGECISGECFCDDWYEGLFCQTEERVQFYGTYTGTAILVGLDTYAESLTLSAHSTIVNRINVDDDFYLELTAVSGGGCSFNIPLQSFVDDGGIAVSLFGTGVITSGELIINGTMSDGVDSYQYTFTGN